MKRKHKEYSVAPQTIATALYEYLEKRGIKVNRKRGIKTYDRYIAGEPAFSYVYVMVRE